MTGLTKMNVGDHLRSAELTSYVSSLGKGVAAAQRELDANSLAQLREFVDTSLDGRSLIQLGLLPTFYQFTKATLSASLSFSLRVTEDWGVGGELSLDTNSASSTQTQKKKGYFKELKSTVVISENKSFTASGFSSSGSALSKIQSYSGKQSVSGSQSVSRSDHYVIAERAAVEGASTLTSSGFIGYNSEAAIFAVAPKSKQWQVWTVTGTDDANAESNAKTLISNHSSADDGYFLGPDDQDHDSDPDDLAAVYFQFDGDSIAPGSDDNKKLRAVAHIATAGALTVKLTGHADAVGDQVYNKDLGGRRARAAAAIVGAYAQTSSVGEVLAVVPESASDADRQTDRRVDVDCGVPANTYYVFLSGSGASLPNKNEGDTHDTLADATLVKKGAYGAVGEGAGIGATSATALKTEIDNHASLSSKYDVSVVGELVYLTNKEMSVNDVFTLNVFDESGTIVDLSENSASSSSSSLTETVKNPKETIKKKLSTAAFAGTIDGRYARSYEMEMKGNLSVTAEMVSVPPPQAFMDYVSELEE